MKTYFDVYQVDPKYIIIHEFLAYPYRPGIRGFSSPFWTFLGSFLATDEAEAIAIARGQVGRSNTQ